MLPRNHCYQYNKMQYYCLYHHKSSLCNSYHWFSPLFLLQEVDQAVHLVLERDVFSYDAFTRVRHAISRKIIIGKSFIIVPNWFEIRASSECHIVETDVGYGHTEVVESNTSPRLSSLSQRSWRYARGI